MITTPLTAIMPNDTRQKTGVCRSISANMLIRPGSAKCSATP